VRPRYSACEGDQGGTALTAQWLAEIAVIAGEHAVITTRTTGRRAGGGGKV